MITGEIKAKVDRIWEIFWTGGVTNPLSVIEQITYLLFMRELDKLQTIRERKQQLGKSEKMIFTEEQKHLRWKEFKSYDPEKMFQVVSEEVFPFIKKLGGDENTSFAKYMSNAVFLIPTANLLERVVTLLDDIPMDDRDTKGDLYEYLLSKISTSGTNGQFRTPRHIIQMIVSMMKPKPSTDEAIVDPAAGSAGFLISATEYLQESHSEILYDEQLREHYNSSMFYGYDTDSTMLRIGAMNMVLHGIENPNVEYRDSLSESNPDTERYTMILANPPFKGSLDESSVASSLKKVVKTKKTELLFLALFLRILKTGGRCACIVPDGVLFGSSNAHKQIRKEIIDNHRLDAVISMPSGVFKPYAGVSTAVLIFTKTNIGGTDKVWFYDMKADGYSLDVKRIELDLKNHEQNNIPDIIQRFSNLEGEKERKRTDQSFFVSVDEIRENGYDISINRYQEAVYEKINYAPPKEIIQSLKQLEKEIQEELEELEEMLG
ncbi:type I restriction enzyme M protein [Croceifilum oryzae]|uniref:site-specific DNA-methyltransferase (adenine-specific) n=1 Tax=Croceifilum oryzae TaxID=1553429 RepID=A0AAJ1TJD7_9BACL|nr:class I SAM-dependent DNA methyltransferase [Croceifilum oryzae]MDQ0417602.1 type I restriction enzyme M protein [Croceifilum oryzae]